MKRGEVDITTIVLSAIFSALVAALMIVALIKKPETTSESVELQTTEVVESKEESTTETKEEPTEEIETGEIPEDAKEVQEVEVKGQEEKKCYRWVQLMPMHMGNFMYFYQIWHTTCN